MNTLRKQLPQIFRGRQLIWTNLYGNGSLTLGHEIVRPGKPYDWDGMTRQSDAGQPNWLFQLTLQGWGLFETGGARQSVPEGSAFLALIPSQHRYLSDPDCPAWEFCWLMIRLPEVHLRLHRHPNLMNAVFPVETAGALLVAFEELGRSLERSDRDFLREEKLFDWLLALERSALARRHPDQPRKQMLQGLRDRVRGDLCHPWEVGKLAAEQHLSRSNFTHHFRKVTGRTPAHYIREVRLEAAAERLLEPDFSIKEIAAQTGFSDSNRFCKAFRQRYRMSPGEYRRLAGQKGTG